MKFRPASLTCLLCLVALLSTPARALDLRDGDVLLYRHALAPGGGDPQGRLIAPPPGVLRNTRGPHGHPARSGQGEAGYLLRDRPHKPHTAGEESGAGVAAPSVGEGYRWPINVLGNQALLSQLLLTPAHLVTSADQEHGIVSVAAGVDGTIAARLPMGTRLQSLPNHACATGAQHPEHYALNSQGDALLRPRFYGW